MKCRTYIHLWVAAIIVALMLGGCSQVPAPSQPASSQPAQPAAQPAQPAQQPAAAPAQPAAPAKPAQRLSVTVGGSFTPNSGPPVWVAQAKGYFEDENLEVKVEKIANFLQQAPALVAGKIDILLGVFPAATTNMVCQGADIKVIAGGTVDDKNLPYSLAGHIVRKDLWDSGEVRKIEDLAGRRFATFGSPQVAKGRSTTYYIDQVYGLTWGKTDIVRVPNDADIVAAMSQKQLDAAFIRAPAYWKALEDGVAVDLVKQKDIVLPQYDMVQTTERFGAKNPEAVVRFLRAYIKAQNYLTEVQNGQHQDEFVQIMKEQSDTPESLIMPFANTVRYTTDLDFEYNQKNHQHGHDVGVIECVPTDEQLYDLSYLQQARGG